MDNVKLTEVAIMMSVLITSVIILIVRYTL